MAIAPVAADRLEGLRTEYDFVLPRGYVDDGGRIHRSGTMRPGSYRYGLKRSNAGRSNGQKLTSMNGVLRWVMQPAKESLPKYEACKPREDEQREQ